MRGGRAAKKPYFFGWAWTIAAAYSFTSRASKRAPVTFDLMMDVPGEVKLRMEVAMLRFALREPVKERSHSGVGHPDGSPPLAARTTREIISYQ